MESSHHHDTPMHDGPSSMTIQPLPPSIAPSIAEEESARFASASAVGSTAEDSHMSALTVSDRAPAQPPAAGYHPAATPPLATAAPPVKPTTTAEAASVTAAAAVSAEAGAAVEGAEGAGAGARRVGLAYDERMMAHQDPEMDHPEQPARIHRIFSYLHSTGLAQRIFCSPTLFSIFLSPHPSYFTIPYPSAPHPTHLLPVNPVNTRSSRGQPFRCIRVPAREARDEELQSVHTRDHLSQQVAAHKLHHGAAAVRPPGHHAEAHCPMGFCLFNNVALAAKHLLDSGGVQRILVVDWDVHHGNGIQHMFWTDPRLLYFSVHRYQGGMFYPAGPDGDYEMGEQGSYQGGMFYPAGPDGDYDMVGAGRDGAGYQGGMFYPAGPDGDYDMVGAGRGEGFNVNVPWPGGGYGDGDYLAAWDLLLLPLLHAFQPQLVLVSAGFDAAVNDPLGGCKLTPFGYSHLTHKLLRATAAGVVVVLEGGYNLESIEQCFAACVSAMLGDPPITAPPPQWPLRLSQSGLATVLQVRKHLSQWWPCLASPLDLSTFLHSLANLHASFSSTPSSSHPPTSFPPHISSTATTAPPALSMDALFSHLSQAEMAHVAATAAAAAALASAGVPVDMQPTSPSTPSDASIDFEDMPGVGAGEVESGTRGMGFRGDGESAGVAAEETQDGAGMGGVANEIAIPLSTCAAASVSGPAVSGAAGMGGEAGMQAHRPPGSRGGHPDTAYTYDGWYGTVLLLGFDDGCPILTFSCSEADLSKFRLRKLPMNPPSEAYRRVVARGLVEGLGMPLADAHAYIDMRSRPL
ncbi:unnamed protein product [Closterium sp. NIES-64]|nr:unnamed protein product [Closterium sp. NIES-64]